MEEISFLGNWSFVVLLQITFKVPMEESSLTHKRCGSFWLLMAHIALIFFKPQRAIHPFWKKFSQCSSVIALPSSPSRYFNSFGWISGDTS